MWRRSSDRHPPPLGKTTHCATFRVRVSCGLGCGGRSSAERAVQPSSVFIVLLYEKYKIVSGEETRYERQVLRRSDLTPDGALDVGTGGRFGPRPGHADSIRC